MVTTSKPEYKVIGTRPVRPDGADKVTGRAQYGADIRLPGMLHARMVRPPSRSAALREVKDGALPGGASLFRDGNLLAAVAEQEHHAEAAAA